jgi:hypothetical protein
VGTQDEITLQVELPLPILEHLIATLKEDCKALHARASITIDPLLAQELRMTADNKDQQAEDIKASIRDRLSSGNVHHIWRHDGVQTDQRGASGSSSIMQVESNKLLPWLMLTCLLSGLSIALAIFSIIRSSDSMRMSMLAREDIRVFDHALTAHGINTDEHASEKGDLK